MNHLPTILFRGYIYIYIYMLVSEGGCSSGKWAPNSLSMFHRRTIPASYWNLEKRWTFALPKKIFTTSHLKRYMYIYIYTYTPSLKLTVCTWDSLFSGAMLVLGRDCLWMSRKHNLGFFGWWFSCGLPWDSSPCFTTIWWICLELFPTTLSQS